jgi:cell division transport system ATP-binding protein
MDPTRTVLSYGKGNADKNTVSVEENSTSPIIRYEGVCVQYTELVHGLVDVSLDIAKGDFVFFCGRTGAGKSTMLKLLSREVSATSGSVMLEDRDLEKLSSREIPALRREMGIVPQDFALLPRKRVWENVAYAMRAVGATRKEVRKRVPEILERVNIGHRADAFPNELSGGEQQRVAIGRALINNPPLLIADEPTGNLDPEHSMEIMEILAALNLRGTTILVASHDMMVVEKMAKRVVTFEEGRVVGDTLTGLAPPPAPEQEKIQVSDTNTPQAEEESPLAAEPEPKVVEEIEDEAPRSIPPIELPEDLVEPEPVVEATKLEPEPEPAAAPAPEPAAVENSGPLSQDDIKDLIASLADEQDAPAEEPKPEPAAEAKPKHESSAPILTEDEIAALMAIPIDVEPGMDEAAEAEAREDEQKKEGK